MRTLEVLRKSLLFLNGQPDLIVGGPDDNTAEYRNSGLKESGELADEIQAEIDRYYLPRPLFEDGEPVQIGDLVSDPDGEADFVLKADHFIYTRDGIIVSDEDADMGCILEGDQRFKRPPEPDTQEKIDSDLGELLGVYVDMDVRKAACAEFSALLERQRKVDGVDT